LGEIFQEMSGRLTALNGEDKLTLFGLTSGGRGSVWGSATFFPALAVELYDAVITKESLSEAQAVWRRIWPIMSALGDVSYQSAVKAGCELVGIPVGPPRLPIAPAPKEYYAKLAAVLRSSGVTVAVGV
jgi:dihydrodipicolinate synthase/N-acetylneuraminate lyase